MSTRRSKVSRLLASNRLISNSEYKIVGKKIGAGNFGEVRLGESVKTGEKVAVKIERINNPKGSSATVRLRHEYDMLRKLYHGFPRGHKINGIPRIHAFGTCGRCDCMVLELLGANLEDLLELVGGKFGIKTVLMIAFQLLDRIETVHKRGLVYRDIKPENFLLGKRDGKESNIIHLVDFGLATFYRDPQSGRHLPYRDLKTMTGTARYMSVHSHLGKSQSRRDDLESIGYVLLYFAKGRLPWQGIRTSNIKEKYRKIRDSKMRFPVHVLCEGLPSQFAAYMTYVKKLAYSEEPDYEYLKDLFHELYEELEFSYNDSTFDWSDIDLPSDLQKFNRSKRAEEFGGEVPSSVDTEDSDQLLFDEEEEEEKEPGVRRPSHRKESDAERLDKLGELRTFQAQARAMAGITDSRWLLKSVSVSNSQLATHSESELEVTVTPSESQSYISANRALQIVPNKTHSNEDSQGYFSHSGNSDEEKVPAIVETPSSTVSQPHRSDLLHVVDPAPGDPSPHRRPSAVCCGCAETTFSEENVNFLCFSWRKKKRDVTYHSEECQLRMAAANGARAN